MSWLDTAKQLAPGKSVRAEHCVRGDKSAVVSAGDNGWSMWCFRCGETVEFEPYPQLSLSERIARLDKARGQDEQAERTISLPEPACYEIAQWPVGHRAWLYKGGLSNDDIARLRIYWCERLDRIVLPVHGEDGIEYWQARGFDKSRPKYINPKIADPPIASFGRGSSAIVLVEDYLSAYRVGQVVRAWGLLGTTLKVSHLGRLLDTAGAIITWLDPDKAGIEKAQVIRKQLRAYGKRPVNIRSEKDPKCLSKAEIISHLKEYL